MCNFLSFLTEAANFIRLYVMRDFIERLKSDPCIFNLVSVLYEITRNSE